MTLFTIDGPFLFVRACVFYVRIAALWNFTANGGAGATTTIYPAVREVNGRLGQLWADALIEFDR